MTGREGHPRPRLVRIGDTWRSLDGQWSFGFCADITPPENLDRSIQVPYAWETPASGIGVHWQDTAWYSRDVAIPPEWIDSQHLLHFDAVHDSSQVYINGTHCADHSGGQIPFTIPIDQRIIANGSFRLDVRVSAPLDKRDIAHGKQRSLPRTDFDGVDFTPTSGIWKSVWLERVPASYIDDAWAQPSHDLTSFDIFAYLSPTHEYQDCKVSASIIGESSITLTRVDSGFWIGKLPVEHVQLWSPETPYLYDICIQVDSPIAHDEVMIYSGLRRIEFGLDGFFINGQRRTIRAVLDQGYWPRTGLTAPTDLAIRRDLELARQAGFNTVRKHIKFEDARFLRAADEMGILVWVEPASTGRFTPASEARFHAQLPVLVNEVRHSPACIAVAAYNEEWGLDWATAEDPNKQEACRKAYRTLKRQLPNHIVIDNSGWEHVETDVVDWHHYVDNPNDFADTVELFHNRKLHEFPVKLGPDLVVTKNFYADKRQPPMILPLMNSEFGGGFTPVERGWNMKWETQELRRWAGLGYVYTELYDVEHEPVGIYDVNRLPKDNGGNPSKWIHSDNTFVLDVHPLQPGRDLVIDEDREIAITWRIATDRGIPAGQLLIAWTAPFQENVPQDAWLPVTAIPALTGPLSEPFTLTTLFPPDSVHARLHLGLMLAGAISVRSWLDIDTRQSPYIGDYSRHSLDLTNGD